MPLAYFIQRLPVAKFFSLTVLGWAIMMLCTAATQNWAGRATVRFISKKLVRITYKHPRRLTYSIVGALEAIVFPTCGLLTVMWYVLQSFVCNEFATN